MKIFTFTNIIFLVLLCCDMSEAGQKIVALQSNRIKPYDQALNGFKSVCSAKIKRLIVAELGEKEAVARISDASPDLVLAIGRDALIGAKKINDIPVVYMMVLNPRLILSGKNNITGVSINIPPEKQLLSISLALPEMNAVGLLYDPERTGPTVQRARAAAGRLGIKLVTKEVQQPGDVPAALMEIKSEIDVFWMLPDINVVTPESVEFIFLFSMEHRIPVISFSEKYVEAGALMSVGIDPFDIGAQAGEMAQKILSGKKVKNIQQADARNLILSVNRKVARKTVISVNQKVAKNLGVTIDKQIFSRAHIVN